MNDDSAVPNDAPALAPADEFALFMRRYQDMVFSTAARLTNDDSQAHDIAQEVFMKAYAHFDQLKTSPTAGGWLKTVARNLALNHLQRYRNRWRFFSEFTSAQNSDGEDAPAVEFAAADTFFNAMDAQDRAEIVGRALAALPEKQRVPLVLYHFEDLSYEEIAVQLRISLSKVKIDILRGRAALAQHLNAAAGGLPIS